MGYFDEICQMVDTVRDVADQGLEDTRRLSEEAERRIREAAQETERRAREATEEAERKIREAAEVAERKARELTEETERKICEAAAEAERKARELTEEAERRLREATEQAERVVDDVKTKIIDTTGSLTQDLEKLIPNMDQKLEEIIDKVTLLASQAAEEGVDITDAVNGAVATAVKNVEDALDAAIDAVNNFLVEAQRQLFSFLENLLPQSYRSLLTELENVIEMAVAGLQEFGSKLKEGIKVMLDKIKDVVQGLVEKVGEVLGPIWQWIKMIWKMLFGEEPEQCELTRQWFEERMARAEAEYRHTKFGNQVSTLIRKRNFFELVPPASDAWKKEVLRHLKQQQSNQTWKRCERSITTLLESTAPAPGHLVHLIREEPLTDYLGGKQCIHISIFYFRWRTAEFQEVSSGFLGILSMISAVGPPTEPQIRSLAPTPNRQKPLEMKASMIQDIYDELAKCMPTVDVRRSDAGASNPDVKHKKISRQLKFRDDNGVWKEVYE